MLDDYRNIEGQYDVFVSVGMLEHVGLANFQSLGALIKRVLKPDGRVVLCSFDWVPLPGSVVEATEELILAHNSSWNLDGGDGIGQALELELAD